MTAARIDLPSVLPTHIERPPEPGCFETAQDLPVARAPFIERVERWARHGERRGLSQSPPAIADQLECQVVESVFQPGPIEPDRLQPRRDELAAAANDERRALVLQIAIEELFGQLRSSVSSLVEEIEALRKKWAIVQ